VVGDLYGNALITTTELIRSNPDLVARFRDALLEGLAYSLDHPDEAGQILHKYQPSLDAESAADELRLMEPSVRGGQDFGDLNPARVARAVAILEGTGIIPTALQPEQVVAFNLVPGARASASR
jgi:NitT/TauT family transport system substrate-binding protein